MIRHPTIKAFIDQCVGNVDSSSEDLVQMSTLPMSSGVRVECTSEIKEVELAIHVADVIVEITTHHDRSISILSQDVLDDIRHSHCSLLLEVLFPWFEVAIQHLHLTISSCHSHPTKVGAECFHQGHSHFRGSRYPTPPIPLQHRLVRPVVVEVEWNLEFGFVQADQVGCFMLNEVTDHFLFCFSVEASNVEGDHGDLIKPHCLLSFSFSVRSIASLSRSL